jgi:hypothetical protein
MKKKMMKALALCSLFACFNLQAIDLGVKSIITVASVAAYWLDDNTRIVDVRATTLHNAQAVQIAELYSQVDELSSLLKKLNPTCACPAFGQTFYSNTTTE